MNQQAGLLAGAQADLEKHENSRDSQLWLCRKPTLQGFNPGELAEMLAWRPDRLGHCCCLTPELHQQLLQ